MKVLNPIEIIQERITLLESLGWYAQGSARDVAIRTLYNAIAYLKGSFNYIGGTNEI